MIRWLDGEKARAKLQSFPMPQNPRDFPDRVKNKKASWEEVYNHAIAYKTKPDQHKRGSLIKEKK